MDCFVPDTQDAAIPIWPVPASGYEAWMAAHGGRMAAWAQLQGFKGQMGRIVCVPDDAGGLAGVLLGVGDESDPLIFGALPRALPEGTYRFSLAGGPDRLAFLGWALGSYRYTKYRKSPSGGVRIIVPGSDRVDLEREAEAVFLVRDLINTPAADMGPADLAGAAQRVARRFGMTSRVIEGHRLLEENYPMIHAVGRAAAPDRMPRLVDLAWGEKTAPGITLVGKGVCFDTGGLNLKTGDSMRLMKKDMGGAASVLALGQMIMGRNLPVRLRILIPAVENAVSADSFRPGDILRSRKGMSVEIGNTDAEGRLILADALSEADSEAPDLLINMATLTGAARVALGPEIAPFYTQDDELAATLMHHADRCADPVWRMPLWQPYNRQLESPVADINHIGQDSFAGSITAALFLSRFVEKARRFIHFDIYGWNARSRPGRPVGGEAQAIRALDNSVAALYAR